MLFSRSFGARTIPLLRTKYSTLADTELKNAKPYEDIPGPKNSFQLLKLMAVPSSKYYNKPLNEINQMLRDDFGNLCFLPGFMGSKPFVVSFLPEDAKKVFRREGRYPYRRNLETMEYYRKKYRPDLFEAGAGIVVE
jgi:cytochrome P450 family 12